MKIVKSKPYIYNLSKSLSLGRQQSQRYLPVLCRRKEDAFIDTPTIGSAWQANQFFESSAVLPSQEAEVQAASVSNTRLITDH